MRLIVVSVLLLFGVVAVASPMDTFVFDSPEQEDSFNRLSNEFRCMVCQNQSIADSNAGLAKDLRALIYSMLQAGKTEDEIADYMVQRYGDYVLYRPPFKPSTWLLWIAPMIAFALGLVFVVRFIRQQNSKADAGELSDEEIERLHNLQAESNRPTSRNNSRTGSQE